MYDEYIQKRILTLYRYAHFIKKGTLMKQWLCTDFLRIKNFPDYFYKGNGAAL